MLHNNEFSIIKVHVLNIFSKSSLVCLFSAPSLDGADKFFDGALAPSLAPPLSQAKAEMVNDKIYSVFYV